MKTIFLTGAAGFIGYHLATRLLQDGFRVVGIDSLNDYYDVALKQARLAHLQRDENFEFHTVNIINKTDLSTVYKAANPDYIIHLAAQAGVRYSLEAPQAYIDANVTGFLNLLELCRNQAPEHFLYASSSSVYGLNTQHPFSEDHTVAQPASLYAASKLANEAMAHSYAHLFGIPLTGLRFFTVYGEYGRPDMVFFKFTKAMLADTPIDVYNNGNMIRDFTYVGDVVESVVRLLPHAPKKHDLYNIGNGQPVQLLDYIKALEAALGKKAQLNMMPMQAGDVPLTLANCKKLQAITGFKPNTSIEDGVEKFVNWYKKYYSLNPKP